MTPQELAAVLRAGARAFTGTGLLREEDLPAELYGPAALRRSLEAMADRAGDIGRQAATYRDPVIIWRPEERPGVLPQAVPPPGEFTVTRSEINIRPQGAVVHIWYAAVPAVPACYRSAIGALVHGPGCTCPVTQ
jgi:hypothetical protein